MPCVGSRLSSRSFPSRRAGLNISCHTVTAHIKKIYRKLQVHSRGEAVYEAAQLGILPAM